jgi:hypothetical protein
MKIDGNIRKHMDILSEITEFGEFFYGGSIADYFNLGGIGFDYDVHDIDINIMDINTLNKIETHFNTKSYQFQSSHYEHNQMVLNNDLILDIFMNIGYEYCERIYENKRILHVSPIGRYNMLKDVVRIFEKQNIHDAQQHQRIFKHLKKIMIYKSILNL